MTEYESDEISIESTSEKSCKNLIPNCNPEHLQKLTQEGSKLNEKLIKTCVENNFPTKENRSKCNLLNLKDKNSNKTIANLESILSIKSSSNNNAINDDNESKESEDMSALYRNLLNSEEENSNNTIGNIDYSFKMNTEKEDMNGDNINKSENILETSKLNSKYNNFNKTIENLNNSEDIKSKGNVEIKDCKDNIKNDISNISKINIKNENTDDTMENQKIFLGKKTERNKEINEDNKKMMNQKIKNIFSVIYAVYRLDYYIKEFKKHFFQYLKNKVNKLIDNIKLPKNKGMLHIHIPNRNLYGGNPKEKDNRDLIDKKIKDVFIDQGIGNTEEDNDDENNINVEEDKKGTSRQENNEIIFNIIEKYQENLLTKLEKNQKYKEQYEAIEKLNKFLELKIRNELDDYYNSDEFGEFRSKAKIRYYDEKFKTQRGRNLSLLELKKENEDNNFVKYVEMPFYRKKQSKK